MILQESLRALFRGPCCVRSLRCEHSAGSIPWSTAQGAKAGQCHPHGAAPPWVGAVARLKATSKKGKEREKGSRSLGTEILAACKSVVQPGFHSFLAGEECDIGMSPKAGGNQGEKLDPAACTATGFVRPLLQKPTKS